MPAKRTVRLSVSLRVSPSKHLATLPVAACCSAAGAAPAEEVINTKLTEQLASVLADLPPREEQVLRKRFGIAEKSDHTLEEVGKLFNVTRERIRQIEAKALRKLRHPVRSQPLRSYYEN